MGWLRNLKYTVCQLLQWLCGVKTIPLGKHLYLKISIYIIIYALRVTVTVRCNYSWMIFLMFYSWHLYKYHICFINIQNKNNIKITNYQNIKKHKYCNCINLQSGNNRLRCTHKIQRENPTYNTHTVHKLSLLCC